MDLDNPGPDLTGVGAAASAAPDRTSSVLSYLNLPKQSDLPGHLAWVFGTGHPLAGTQVYAIDVDSPLGLQDMTLRFDIRSDTLAYGATDQACDRDALTPAHPIRQRSVRFQYMEISSLLQMQPRERL
ncbi:hypothetical protein MPH_04340 [Macrophomina phaseolina MS6]|uniref:Uncharacterized protein n=1 Tax=Macrophomina phaseolina (strain MS6) TaxID=1126212 RepID=K2RUW3_MACPH|nr:hypothetical protein MPH_04340 [Macrophomina phaseolina MS6]